MKNFFSKNILYIAFAQGLIAMLGSLYYSEIRHFAPCVLCWWQRIFMYPLVLILAVGIIQKDKKIYNYVLPMSILGGIIAFYHVLLQKGIIPEALGPCTQTVPCVTKFTGYFGFITIPVMALTAFIVITLCMLYYKKIKK